jgi:hypothetical protein
LIEPLSEFDQVALEVLHFEPTLEWSVDTVVRVLQFQMV